MLHLSVKPIADAIVVPDVRPNPSLTSPFLGGMTILIVGVDERPEYREEGVRSDTLMLAHVNMFEGWVNLLSIPRDSQIELPDIGTTKINVAYGRGYEQAETRYGVGTTPQQGGMASAAQAVEQFCDSYGRGIRIHHIAQVNFAGFVEIIDAMGGISIDVPKHIIDDEYPTPNFGTMTVEFQPGPQEMDGATALIYARTRHADSDFHRAQRQQQVVQAIIQKFRSASWIQRAIILRKIGKQLETGTPPPFLTTLPIARVDMLIGMIALAARLEADRIGHLLLRPPEVDVTEVGSNLIWDGAGVRAQLDQLFLPPQQHDVGDQRGRE